MPRSKARPEGARHTRHDFVQPAMIAQEAARREAEEPVADDERSPEDYGAQLREIGEYFKAKHPDEWAQWAKCPLESGLAAMAEKLKG